MSYKIDDASEIWKDIKGYEGLYQVSNLGRVKSLPRVIDRKTKGKRQTEGQILNPWKRGMKGGEYLCVEIWEKTYSVHRLVAQAFIPNPENKEEIDHINRNRFDNRVENLRWATRIENQNNPLTKEHRKNIAKKGEDAWRWMKRGAENGKSKAVEQYDMEGNYIATFESVREAGRITGVGYRGIAMVANGTTRCGDKIVRHHKAGGYIWKWKKEYNN